MLIRPPGASDDDIATGLIAGLESARARRILDMVVAIGVVVSDSGESTIRSLMRASGLSDKDVGEAEIAAWRAGTAERSKRKAQEWLST